MSEKWTYAYNPLGNLTSLTDGVGTKGATMLPVQADPDRVCRINLGNGGVPGFSCNVDHDSFGNVVAEPTRTGHRKLQYFTSGGLRTSTTATDTAPTLRTTRSVRASNRRARRQRRGVRPQLRHAHQLALPRDGGGQGVVRRAPVSRRRLRRQPPRQERAVNLDMAEARGTRFSFNDAGQFVQDVSYSPFGEAQTSGAQPGTAPYSSEQWNGGEAFDQLGVVKLGARFFDPVIGRFLSRDPLFVARTAATTNPYAFANNDPINRSDPSGLDDGSGFGDGGCIGNECQGPGGTGFEDDFFENPIPPELTLTDGRHGPQSHAARPPVVRKAVHPLQLETEEGESENPLIPKVEGVNKWVDRGGLGIAIGEHSAEAIVEFFHNAKIAEEFVEHSHLLKVVQGLGLVADSLAAGVSVAIFIEEPTMEHGADAGVSSLALYATIAEATPALVAVIALKAVMFYNELQAEQYRRWPAPWSPTSISGTWSSTSSSSAWTRRRPRTTSRS